MADRVLSREEEDEVKQSNRKVNEGQHAEFGEGSRAVVPPQGLNTKKTSFKDKLMGEIPGAYVQTFEFPDALEIDTELDDEVETLMEGFAEEEQSSCEDPLS